MQYTVLEAMTRVYGQTENSTPRKYKMDKDIQTPPEYMITLRSWVVHNLSKIGSPNFAGGIGEV